MKTRYTIFICIALALASLPAVGQTLAQARALYAKGEYAQAKPVFQRFVKSAPSNGNYNLWYGVCCLETGEYEKSVPYLEKAVKRRIPSGQYHLARAYDLTYRFEEAQETNDAYLKDLKRRRRDTSQADSLGERIRTHLRMFKGVERVCVIDSFAIGKAEFLNAYKISPESGSLAFYADYFGEDGHTGGTVYETEMGNKMYYGEFQEDSTFNILTRSKMMDEWSRPTPLPGIINRGVNANYPFVLTDGATLYYASDGRESMGGYDIFVTRYNTNTDTYLTPENVGMPFNSPYNDYMYVVDEFNNLGWFASDRYQPADSVCVYVFIPNASKQVYDYETMDHKRLALLANLKDIGQTWSDTTLVEEARERLAQAMEYRPKEKKAYDFTFIINDAYTYHQMSDFRSPRAKELFTAYRQLEQGLRQQSETLAKARQNYANASAKEKQRLAPSILDLEKRVRALSEEVGQKAKQVRNTEIQALQH